MSSDDEQLIMLLLLTLFLFLLYNEEIIYRTQTFLHFVLSIYNTMFIRKYLTLKTSVGAGLLDTSIGVSSWRLEGWPGLSVCSEDKDLIWPSNKQVSTKEGPSVLIV